MRSVHSDHALLTVVILVLPLRNPDLTFEAFYEQVRIGRGEMPTFTEEELPDGYLVHLWAWITQPTGE
jgi:hypothetical protein